MNKIYYMLSICILSALWISPCNSYKGLLFMVRGTKSHLNFYEGVMEALTENGHQITFITPYKMANTKENVTQILLTENVTEDILGNTFEFNRFAYFKKVIKYIPEICATALSEPQVVEALKEKYDYIIFSILFSECLLFYPYENKIPVIFISPNTIASPYSERFGIPEIASVTPHKMLHYSYPFSFFQRVHLTIVNTLGAMYIDYLTKLTEDKAREYNLWSPETPSVWELQKEASMVIINSVKTLEFPPRSMPPSVIYAGGIHIKPTKPLSQDLANWLDNSGDAGFILFSLGTAVKAKHMKHEHLKSILNVFRNLDQRIIWKWDSEDINDLPPNVKLSPWLPQQDILAHPKIRLFITHGGLFSTQEATYHEVPVIEMPLFVDQSSNVADIVSEGWGRKVDWNDLTEETFGSVINEVLIDNKLREQVHRRSKLMRDSPQTPKEEVSFWVDYTIRHKGAKHLQSPLVHLSWYEIYNIDVWIFILMIFISILVAFCLLIKFCFKICFQNLFKSKQE